MGIDKAQCLSKHLGFDTVIDRRMTLAEISDPIEPGLPEKRVEVIGLKRLRWSTDRASRHCERSEANSCVTQTGPDKEGLQHPHG